MLPTTMAVQAAIPRLLCLVSSAVMGRSYGVIERAPLTITEGIILDLGQVHCTSVVSFIDSPLEALCRCESWSAAGTNSDGGGQWSCSVLLQAVGTKAIQQARSRTQAVHRGRMTISGLASEERARMPSFGGPERDICMSTAGIVEIAMSEFRLLSRSRQITDYSCGASALRIVLSYWGRDVDEAELMELLHTNAEVGTNPEDIVNGARSLGFDAKLFENLTLDQLERLTADGTPVIVLGQMWRSERELAPSARGRLGQWALRCRAGGRRGLCLFAGPLHSNGQGFRNAEELRGPLAPGHGRKSRKSQAHSPRDRYQGQAAGENQNRFQTQRLPSSISPTLALSTSL